MESLRYRSYRPILIPIPIPIVSIPESMPQVFWTTLLQTWVSRGSFARPAIKPLAQLSLDSPPNNPLHAWPADARLAILLDHRHQPSRSGLAGHACCGSPRPGRAHEQAAWLGKPWHMCPAWPGRCAARAIACVPSQAWAACVASHVWCAAQSLTGHVRHTSRGARA